MATHWHIGRICLGALAAALVLCLVLYPLRAAGPGTAARTPAYAAFLFDTGLVHSLDIRMDDWAGFLAGCEDEEYLPCTVIIDNEAFKNIGIRAKGNTSLQQVSGYGSQRYSFKLEFDHYESGKSYHGLDKLCLNNLIQDNTLLKDYFCYRMMAGAGVAAPLVSFVWVTVGGEDFGLYLAVEGVEDSFLARNYGSAAGQLYKPDPTMMGGGRGEGRGFDWNNFLQRGEDAAAADGGEDAAAADSSAPADARGDADAQPGGPGANDGGGAQPTPPNGDGGENGFGNGSPGGFPGFGEGGFTPGGEMPGDEMPGDEMPGDGELPFGGELPGGEMPFGTEVPDMTPDGDTESGFGGFTGGLPGGFGGGFGGVNASSDVLLTYTDDDPASYPNIFDNAKTDVTAADQARLIAALKSVNEQTGLENALYTDQVVQYFAVHNFVCNFDSYTGSMVHNYYLYEQDGRLAMIPWDYNLAFGGFMGQSDAAALVNYPIDTPVSGQGVDARPMLRWIFSQQSYTDAYHAALAQLLARWFENGAFEAELARMTALLDPYVAKDTDAFCSYAEWQAGVAALLQFCSLRAESVAGQLAGMIPATADGQAADSSAFVTADGLSLSAMGGMGGMRGMDGMRGTSDAPDASNTPNALNVPNAPAVPNAPGAQNGGMRPTNAAPTGGAQALVLGICLALLAGGLVFAARYRRR